MPLDPLFGTPQTSQTVASADRDQSNLVSRLRQLFLDARNHRRSRYDAWIRNYRLTHTRGGGPSYSWMPSPRDSEIYPTLSALVGWMTDQNTQVQFIPATDPHGMYYDWINKLAKDLEAVFNSNWITEDYDSQAKLVLWDTFLYGAGIFKNVWDNGLSGGYGNVLMRRVDPWSWYPDPYATSMDDLEYCVEARRMTFDSVIRRFPNAEGVLRVTSDGEMDGIDERPSLFTEARREPMANPGALPGGTGVYGQARSQRRERTTQPTLVVYEFWIRENRTYYKSPSDSTKDKVKFSEKRVEDRWRVIVLCQNQILMDEWASDLFSHGSHPYERNVFDDVGDFYGISLVDHLAFPQLYINRLLSSLHHNVDLIGNPVFVEGSNSGLSRVGIVNRPGQRLTLQGPNAMAMNKPEWLVPPSMPQEVMGLVEFWLGRIENISGLSAIVRGATPTARNSQGVMDSVQEAAFIRIRSALHNYETTLRRNAFKLSDLIVDNYTEPRIMAIIGPDGQQTSLALTARHFNVPTSKGATPLKYAITVQAGASAATSRQARMAEADQAFAMGAIDDQALLEAHQWTNIEEILKRLYWKRTQGLIGGGPAARQRAGRTS